MKIRRYASLPMNLQDLVKVSAFQLSEILAPHLRAAAVALLVFSGLTHAQGDIVIDNVAPAFTTTGTWPTSTSVSGYMGSNYQTHEANGAPPSAISVDNTDAGFSTTGSWSNSTSVSGYLGSNYQVHPANGAPPTAVVADNLSGSFSGTWPASTSVGGYYGTNYQTHTAGTGANVFTWSLTLANAGNYEVYARWTAHPNRATNAKYTVNHASGSNVVVVNQEQNSGTWVLLGTYSFNAGGTTISLSDEANDYVIADAVMIVPPGAAPNTATWTLNVASAGSYNVYARWTAHPNRATDAKYTVNHAGGAAQVTANQQNNTGAWNLLGTYSFNTGNATVSLTDQANGYVIADAVMLLPPGAQPNTATWTPNVAQAGTYEVFARWTANPNRATNATYTVMHGQGSTNVPVNQQADGGVWNSLGTFTFASGSAHKVTLTDQANGYVIADAIRLVPVSLQPNLALYYVHPDHLNTPRQVYDDQQQLRWRWDQAEPFGVTTPDENPASLGAFELPLRFPGQFADKETNISFNFYRDYDSAIGRYVQSDPIGLHGGFNTFAYVENSPLSSYDPTGLSSLVFNRKAGTMDVYDDSGNLLFSCLAGNNVTRWSKGPFPGGSYPFSHYNRHPQSGGTGPFGSYGIFIFKVPGRTGMGVHSGRQGPQSPTLGCIRTDDPCMLDLNMLHRFDPIKEITVQ